MHASSPQRDDTQGHVARSSEKCAQGGSSCCPQLRGSTSVSHGQCFTARFGDGARDHGEALSSPPARTLTWHHVGVGATTTHAREMPPQDTRCTADSRDSCIRVPGADLRARLVIPPPPPGRSPRAPLPSLPARVPRAQRERIGIRATSHAHSRILSAQDTTQQTPDVDGPRRGMRTTDRPQKKITGRDAPGGGTSCGAGVTGNGEWLAREGGREEGGGKKEEDKVDRKAKKMDKRARGGYGGGDGVGCECGRGDVMRQRRQGGGRCCVACVRVEQSAMEPKEATARGVRVEYARNRRKVVARFVRMSIRCARVSPSHPSYHNRARTSVPIASAELCSDSVGRRADLRRSAAQRDVRAAQHFSIDVEGIVQRGWTDAVEPVCERR
ncbi:hypothetical protein B0H11DRAFT_1905407 [Mycena galericulata]|nr:hypothetical protein B0H11DRAFT_1905407 [Mycena galericulata]